MPESSPNIVTPAGRVYWPSVFEMKNRPGGGAPCYEITLYFPPEADLSELKAGAAAAAAARWGNKIPPGLYSPFRSAAEVNWVNEYTVGTVITFRADKSIPKVVDQARNLMTKESGRFYGGCWARVACNAYTYDNAMKKGVAFGLLNVQKVRDDSPLSGRTSDPNVDFDVIPDLSENPFAEEKLPPGAADLFR